MALADSGLALGSAFSWAERKVCFAPDGAILGARERTLISSAVTGAETATVSR
jgi:hypothetical protein